MLTARQKHAYDFIAGRIRAGQPPSVREIAAHMGASKSAGNGHNLVRQLLIRGYLRRTGGARGLALVRGRYFKWDDEAKELRPWP